MQVLRSSESLPVRFWAAAGRRVSVEKDAFWRMWGLVLERQMLMGNVGRRMCGGGCGGVSWRDHINCGWC